MLCWRKGNETEQPKVKSHKYGKLTLDKVGSQYNGERIVFSTNDTGM